MGFTPSEIVFFSTPGSSLSFTKIADHAEMTDLLYRSNAAKDERFVSRYIANAIYCIIWKYRDIAIFRKYRDILTIFSVSDNGQF